MGNDKRKNAISRHFGTPVPKDDLAVFKENILELKTLANTLQLDNKLAFLIKISNIEHWLKLNHANKKLMRSAKNRIQTLKSKIENSI